jgi:hypothetical protein
MLYPDHFNSVYVETPYISYADFSVMPTMSCEDAAGLAGAAGMSA